MGRPIAITLALLTLMAMAGCAQEQRATTQVPAGAAITVYGPDGEAALKKDIAGMSGDPLLAAMQEGDIAIETAQYSFGAYIKSIAGISQDEKHYIAIYVDGNYSQKGISDLRLGDGSLIEFRLEEIKPA
ncbi:MAG: DUF4430 domain-containing protein [Candidatus Diapherotrites archaeon]|uniref:DUF4430 domain-containing protein n=1 Tax=Candidatus Iainarchaeum sp. TaxID=3101447 RepID=A0A8T3YIF9_9ARCH|nr:DUF4430 domain-containing protein [Candidatus Diapherotrites archaeon]